jgi:inosine-uridine nucleoside N-ribohydrolase
VDFLADQVREHDGAVTLVPTGPLTNVALLLALHPDARPERIVLMGGAIAEGNVTRRRSSTSGRPGGRCARLRSRHRHDDGRARRHTQGAVHLAHVRAARGTRGADGGQLLEFYGHFHKEVYNFDGSPIHDAVAVAHVIRDDLVRTEHLNTEIDVESELCRGTHRRRPVRRSAREPNSHVGVDIDADGFLDLLVERLNSLQ